jgi:hypothetical protein
MSMKNWCSLRGKLAWATIVSCTSSRLCQISYNHDWIDPQNYSPIECHSSGVHKEVKRELRNIPNVGLKQ